jgi:NAD(P)-dependent dehydrogenase (short-subunit alcohol dehydrogenase family)
MSAQKVALVTGSANGIGKSIVNQLAEDGFAVVINDLELNKEKAEALAEELRQKGHTASVKLADVSNFDQVKEMVESLDRLDVVRTSRHVSSNSSDLFMQMVANAAVVAPVDFITDG